MPRTYTNIIPMPPSVNAAYKNIGKHGRAKSQEYKAWLIKVESFRLDKPREGPPPLMGDIMAVYALGTPKGYRRWDIANREKLISDLLTHWSVYMDDIQIVDLRVRLDPTVPEGMVKIQLVEMA